MPDPQPSFTTPRRYCRDRRDETVACALDDVVLLYHRASGQTHMMISPVPEILDAIEEEPATAAQVHDQLARRFDLGDFAEVVPVIEMHLADLAALGLVRAG